MFAAGTGEPSPAPLGSRYDTNTCAADQPPAPTRALRRRGRAHCAERALGNTQCIDDVRGSQLVDHGIGGRHTGQRQYPLAQHQLQARAVRQAGHAGDGAKPGGAGRRHNALQPHVVCDPTERKHGQRGLCCTTTLSAAPCARQPRYAPEAGAVGARPRAARTGDATARTSCSSSDTGDDAPGERIASCASVAPNARRACDSAACADGSADTTGEGRGVPPPAPSAAAGEPGAGAVSDTGSHRSASCSRTRCENNHPASDSGNSPHHFQCAHELVERQPKHRPCGRVRF
jgi:hypothetical protein